MRGGKQCDLIAAIPFVAAPFFLDYMEGNSLSVWKISPG